MQSDSSCEDLQNGNSGDARPIQYSLATMLIVMTLLAVVCSGLFAGPQWLTAATAGLLTLIVPLVLTVTLIYGKGYLRTFCIGAIFPAGTILSSGLNAYGMLFYGIGGNGLGDSNTLETRLIIALVVLAIAIVIVVCGLIAMGVRRMLDGHGQLQPRNEPSQNT